MNDKIIAVAGPTASGKSALALELCAEIRQRFPAADVRSYPLRGLCSYYAERGGIMLGFES